MLRTVSLSLSLLALLATAAHAAGLVKVEGSDRKVPDALSLDVNGTPTPLRLTGTGLREKAWVNVYIIASYLADGVVASSAASLAAADAPKVLLLVLERDVDGDTMGAALRESIEANAGQKFAADVKQLEAFFTKHPVKTGMSITFTAIPGQGVVCEIGNGAKLSVATAGFQKAVWDIWLGSKPAQDSIKKTLVKRL